MKYKVYVIVGPTASGKTDLGIKLAKKIDGAAVSADSRQVYTGMDIGTAKPVIKSKVKSQKSKIVHDALIPDLVEGVDHYLFNIRKPNNQLTLAEWQAAANAVIDSLIKRGVTPLLVGGTMLYVDSIVFNYDIPRVKIDNNLRQDLEGRTVEELYKELKDIDPEVVEFMQPNNKRRIIRALEVIKTTGKKFSEQRKKRRPKYDFEMIGIFPSWETLKDRVSLRMKEVLKEGLIEETEKIREKYGGNLPLLMTMNYKQAAAVLDGKMTKDEAEEEMIRVNMRYAHRQMSWWRGRDEIRWYSSVSDVLSKLE